MFYFQLFAAARYGPRGVKDQHLHPQFVLGVLPNEKRSQTLSPVTKWGWLFVCLELTSSSCTREVQPSAILFFQMSPSCFEEVIFILQVKLKGDTKKTKPQVTFPIYPLVVFGLLSLALLESYSKVTIRTVDSLVIHPTISISTIFYHCILPTCTHTQTQKVLLILVHRLLELR